MKAILAFAIIPVAAAFVSLSLSGPALTAEAPSTANYPSRNSVDPMPCLAGGGKRCLDLEKTPIGACYVRTDALKGCDTKGMKATPVTMH
jgi:hypothetical protein